MDDYRFIFEEKPDDYLLHYGVGHDKGGHSGRFPWGSGDDPYQHDNKDWLDHCKELEAGNYTWVDEEGEFGPKGVEYKGEAAVAHMKHMTTKAYRAQKSIATNDRKMEQYYRAKAMRESGMGYSQIAKELGLPNESSARSILREDAEYERELAQRTADFLKEQIDNKGMIEIGADTELYLGITENKLDIATELLKMEGYEVMSGRIKNITDPSGDHQTTLTVIAPPGTAKNAIYNYGDINFMSNEDYENFRQANGIESLSNYISYDHGETFTERIHEYPASLDPSRLYIRYPDEGGDTKDGIIEIRRGVKDLSLGESTYAQTRILVDNQAYLKGVAVYSDDMPDGIDIVFNTSKPRGSEVYGKVLKKIKTDDPDNPFGSNLKEVGGQYHYIDDDGTVKLGLINKTREEGDWSDWSDKLPSQFLAKQSTQLAEQQLDIALNERYKEYNEIMNLDNGTIKKYYLNEFASDCDSNSVHLYAAALPRQKHQVLLPFNDVPEGEIYAPNYNDGETVALVRYPHEGIFQIPVLKVNNKNQKAIDVYGKDLKDAVVINSETAKILSGADFDGDTAMVIPFSNTVKISSKKPFAGLKDFDAHDEYKTTKKVDENGNEVYYNKYGKRVNIMQNTDTQMGIISNLIMDMTLQGATDEELERATKYSMTVIDANKHKLDYRSCYIEQNIDELKRKYQTGGASTLITRAKAEYDVDKRQGTPLVNLKGKSYYDETRPEGSLIFKKADEKKLHYYQYVDGKKKYDGYLSKDGTEFTYKTKDGEKHTVSAIDNPNVVQQTRKQKSSYMAETDDARSLISTKGTTMEALYADYANALKTMANQARKDAAETIDIKKNSEAVKEYADVVEGLKKKLTAARMNSSKERQAQTLATTVSTAKQKAASTKMEKKDIKKLNDRELKNARKQVGASRKTIDISDKEWKAIQAGAITATDLRDILRYSDKEKLRERAMNRQSTLISPATGNRIEQMKSNGYTSAEISEALGISTTKINNYLREEA